MVLLWHCPSYMGVYCCLGSPVLSLLAVVYCSWVGGPSLIILEMSALAHLLSNPRLVNHDQSFCLVANIQIALWSQKDDPKISC